MFLQFCLSLLVAINSASALSLKFDVGRHDTILKGIAQCEGHENTPMTLVSGTMEDSICMPGETTMSSHTIISEDLPTDLVFDLQLKKLTPFPMTVPCINGIGSCAYDLCNMIENTPAICDALPEYQPCSCPLLKGELELTGLKLPVPDMGPIMDEVMIGAYSAHALLYGASNPEYEIGCVDFEFELKKC